MSTWGDLKTAIRADVDDSGATQKWSDDLLFLYAKDAIRDYSLWFPVRKDRVELSGSGSGPYTLPADFVEVLFVECPEDRFLEARIPRPGTRFPSRAAARPFYYHIEGGALYVDGTPLSGDAVALTYTALRSTPDAADDDSHVLDIPDRDEELIRLYVRGKLHAQMRGKQAALDRFKSRNASGGERTDNPLSPEVDDVMATYFEKIARRLGGGTIVLNVMGRTR